MTDKKIYTLCQRLVDHEKIGFEYDYMGAAEYEFGSTREARKYLNDAKALTKRVCSVYLPVLKKRMNCEATFSESDAVRVSAFFKHLQDGSYQNKGAMSYRNPPLGWLVLHPVPMLIAVEGNEERAQKFLDHARGLFSEKSA